MSGVNDMIEAQLFQMRFRDTMRATADIEAPTEDEIEKPLRAIGFVSDAKVHIDFGGRYTAIAVTIQVWPGDDEGKMRRGVNRVVDQIFARYRRPGQRLVRGPIKFNVHRHTSFRTQLDAPTLVPSYHDLKTTLVSILPDGVECVAVDRDLVVPVVVVLLGGDVPKKSHREAIAATARGCLEDLVPGIDIQVEWQTNNADMLGVAP